MLKVSKLLKASADSEAMQRIAAWDSITEWEWDRISGGSYKSGEMCAKLIFYGIKDGAEISDSFEVDLSYKAHVDRNAGFDHEFGHEEGVAIEFESCELTYPPLAEWPQNLLEYRSKAFDQMAEHVSESEIEPPDYDGPEPDYYDSWGNY